MSGSRPIRSDRITAAWNRLWFEPAPVSTVAVLRMIFGLLAIAWSLTLLPDATTFFSSEGIVPVRPEEVGKWSVLDLFGSGEAALGLCVITLLAGLTLTIGLASRASAIVVLVGMTSFQRTNPFIGNGGDVLLRVMMIYLALAPAGAALSVDRWRTHRSDPWGIPMRAPWALRMVQFQIGLIYVSNVWQKSLGHTWLEGTAVSYAVRLEDLVRLPLPHATLASPGWAKAFTWATLGVEGSLAILIWNRKTRPFVLAAGVMLHLGVDYAFKLGFLSWTVIGGYIAFVPPEKMSRAIARVRARLEGVRTPTRALGP